MKIKLTATCLVISVLMPPLAYAVDYAAPQTKFGVIVKDSVITTKIKSKLTAEKMAYATNIKVETDSNGVVRLSGKVATKEEMKRVEEITHDTDGVKSVQNEIRVGS
ncbi:BON domain-containing protein [Glaciimonas immobilis]|uniref:Hyperosmotically inducible protein n=1 Tax=Glaciimonas immobilis TaxID=728004 RepID=A0A840RUB5_9BURK|nr:BON domain-containing protein [Glaciimonas immobilis]KAF3996330.1 BON domain-containing protein [Glaciimonas immobilis]MBB5202167.1 hyperosmotically inducible protein [Glaciimonas immobilis]